MGKSFSALAGTSETPDLEPAFRDMLRFSTRSSLSPHAE
jgi:hypothetical protein